MIARPLTLSLAVALLSQPLAAATVHTWSGATENACRNRCDQAWAEGQLTKEELAALRAEQERHPAPYPVAVNDGDVFDLMTYFKDGQAQAYRTTTVAALGKPEGAEGWDMGDWAWVKLDACANWAILRKLNVGATTGADIVAPLQTVGQALILASAPGRGISGGGLLGWTPGRTDWPNPVVTAPDCDRCAPVPPCPPVAAVSLPSAALLLLTALAGLLWFKRKGGAV